MYSRNLSCTCLCHERGYGGRAENQHQIHKLPQELHLIYGELKAGRILYIKRSPACLKGCFLCIKFKFELAKDMDVCPVCGDSLNDEDMEVNSSDEDEGLMY